MIWGTQLVSTKYRSLIFLLNTNTQLIKEEHFFLRLVFYSSFAKKLSVPGTAPDKQILKRISSSFLDANKSQSGMRSHNH